MRALSAQHTHSPSSRTDEPPTRFCPFPPLLTRRSSSRSRSRSRGKKSRSRSRSRSKAKKEDGKAEEEEPRRD